LAKQSARRSQVAEARARCKRFRSQGRKGKKGKDSVAPADGRRFCAAVKSDGNHCSYRARTQDGFCKRHDVHHQARRSAEYKDKQKERLAKNHFNARSVQAEMNEGREPVCPQCGTPGKLEWDDAYFNFVYLICMVCCKRIDPTKIEDFVKSSDRESTLMKALEMPAFDRGSRRSRPPVQEEMDEATRDEIDRRIRAELANPGRRNLSPWLESGPTHRASEEDLAQRVKVEPVFRSSRPHRRGSVVVLD
jgi:hypothetical protein